MASMVLSFSQMTNIRPKVGAKFVPCGALWSGAKGSQNWSEDKEYQLPRERTQERLSLRLYGLGRGYCQLHSQAAVAMKGRLERCHFHPPLR